MNGFLVLKGNLFICLNECVWWIKIEVMINV